MTSADKSSQLTQGAVVDLNPTTPSHWTNQLWIAGVEPQEQRFVDKTDYAHIIINPKDNLDNLPAEYVDGLDKLPERQRKRFFLGLFQGDVEGALWRRQIIGRLADAPRMRRIVVAIDPAVSTKVGSDETGIVVVGLDPIELDLYEESDDERADDPSYDFEDDRY